MRRIFLILGVVTAVLIGGQSLPLPWDLQPVRPPDQSDGGQTGPDQSSRRWRTKNQSVPDPATETQTTSAVDAGKAPAKPTRKRAAASDPIVMIDDKPYPLRTYKPLLIPNDPSASQWWVANTSLDKAWDIPRGPHETILAVIDTGFALKHEEFAGRWYSSPGETGAASSENPSTLNCRDRGLTLDNSCNLIDDNGDGVIDNESGVADYQNPSRLNCSAQGVALAKNCNRIDDDNNGFVDDVTGWDFINYDNNTQAGELNPAGTGTTHGTLVTGAAAATGDNGKGIAGVDWGTKIMPLQALDDDSYGDTRSVGRAIYYAVKQGADVINISLGSDNPDPYVEAAIQAATAAGTLVVASSGNDGCECMVYPANYTEVVAAGALNTSNVPASFSSWGANLDLLAPGTSISTPTWSSSNQTSAYAGSVNGTSFSAPIVSGMATRLLSHQPGMTPMQLISVLTETTNRLGLSSTTPHSTTLGFGSLNAQQSTRRATTAHTPPIVYAFIPISRGGYTGMTTHIEAKSDYYVYQCENGTVGTTLVHELLHTNGNFFSINKTEVSRALGSGYTLNRFAWLCLQQPHDKPEQIRSINLYQEFRNIYTPLR